MHSPFSLHETREIQIENIEKCVEAAREKLARYTRIASKTGNYDDMLMLLHDISIDAANLARNITQYKINIAEVDREIDRLPEE